MKGRQQDENTETSVGSSLQVVPFTQMLVFWAIAYIKFFIKAALKTKNYYTKSLQEELQSIGS